MLEGQAILTCQLFSSLLLYLRAHVFLQEASRCVSAREKNPLDRTEKPSVTVVRCWGGRREAQKQPRAFCCPPPPLEQRAEVSSLALQSPQEPLPCSCTARGFNLPSLTLKAHHFLATCLPPREKVLLLSSRKRKRRNSEQPLGNWHQHQRTWAAHREGWTALCATRPHNPSLLSVGHITQSEANKDTPLIQPLPRASNKQLQPQLTSAPPKHL